MLQFFDVIEISERIVKLAIRHMPLLSEISGSIFKYLSVASLCGDHNR